jgi:peptidoglycan/LPS O-acetylase OafA/YrhL
VTALQGFGSRRLRSIDALRGIAALSVVVFHASLFNQVHSKSWAGSWPDLAFEWGRFGVWLFFVISGFCIHLRWASEYRADRMPQLDFIAFWTRRFIRPSLWYRGWIGTASIAGAMAATVAYIGLTEGMVRNVLWCATDVAWGLGFFVWVNCAAEAEKRWRIAGTIPRGVVAAASLGLFSYSLYLTHELIIQHLWPLVAPDWTGTTAPMLMVILLAVVSVAFARVFFAWFERPFMVRARAATATLAPAPAV